MNTKPSYQQFQDEYNKWEYRMDLFGRKANDLAERFGFIFQELESACDRMQLTDDERKRLRHDTAQAVIKTLAPIVYYADKIMKDNPIESDKPECQEEKPM